METGLRIGELSSRHGLSTATLRYYERLGLLGAPARSDSGYRLFTSDDDDRLRFIMRAKALDLTLEEIRSLLDAWQQGKRQETRANLRHLVAHKIREVRARAREAEAFADQLTHVYDRLSNEDGGPLPSGACGCIPDLPARATVALDAELALIEHAECSCGGRLGDTDDCACGCCAPTSDTSPGAGITIPIELGIRLSRGGDDIMTNDSLTLTDSDEVASTCACCAPAAVQTLVEEDKDKKEKKKDHQCNCGSGSSVGCGPDCGCGH